MPSNPSRPQPRAAVHHDRLVSFGARACVIARRLHHDSTGRHIGGQLVRCGTAPAAHYAEACEAESRADFIHKMKLCAKELRESLGWLRTALRAGFNSPDLEPAERECEELLKIAIASINTARTGRRRLAEANSPNRQ